MIRAAEAELDPPLPLAGLDEVTFREGGFGDALAVHVGAVVALLVDEHDVAARPVLEAKVPARPPR